METLDVLGAYRRLSQHFILKCRDCSKCLEELSRLREHGDGRGGKRASGEKMQPCVREGLDHPVT